jgi:uncharacterized protein
MWLFASDLHGHQRRYEALFHAVGDDPPDVLLLGGDLFPAGRGVASARYPDVEDFTGEYLLPRFTELRDALGARFPQVLFILGNDDRRSLEPELDALSAAFGAVHLHNRRVTRGPWTIAGYACVPPSPFRLKDWERYDVSRYTDPGCIPPDEGVVTSPVSAGDIARGRTMQDDLAELAEGIDVRTTVFLFHAPPYKTALDRAALDGKMVDHAPLDVHVGSIAMRRFIERREPLVTLHGHIHESARITGAWRDRIGPTHLFGAAHDGPELALVHFDPAHPDTAVRHLV